MEDKQATPTGKLTRQQIVDLSITLMSAALALLYMYTAYFGQLPVFQQRGIILAFSLVMIYFRFPMFRAKGKRPAWTVAVDVVLSAATVVCVYALIQAEKLLQPGVYYKPTGVDIALGMALIVAVIEATRRLLGLILPVLALVAFLYALFGHLLPGLLSHLQLEFDMTIYYVAITSEGIFGLPLYVVSTIVIIFLIFASLLGKLGLMEFFIDLSTGLMGKYRGGPAKIAVVSSAFLATLSGSAVANVVGTGSFTIPLMKRTGYQPDFAGAVESCASTGGVVTPPVMGAAAFIMAEYLGVSYWAIVVAASLPAFLYFVGVYIGVDLQAMKLGLVGMPREQLPKVGRVLRQKGYMLAPVLVLVYYLGVVRSSAMLAAFWGIVCILAVALIKKETRQKMLGMGLLDGLASGIKDAMIVVATCATAGIVIGVLIVTGLSMRMSTILISVSGGNLLVLLLLSAVVCIILGMGITTTAIYILMAMIMAPAIVKLGVPPLAAHLFVLFLANMSNITPPVAVAVFAACGISGGKPMATAWQAVKLGIVLFIVPFFFSYNPGLIMQGSPLDVTVSTITAIIGVVILAFAINDHWWWGKIGLLSRFLFGLGGLALIYPAVMISVAGGVLTLVAILYERLFRKQKSPAAA